MHLLGLTGGIGSGKSTVSQILKRHGYKVIDADEIARNALRPGEITYDEVVEAFGTSILVDSSIEIDRKKLANTVFSNKDLLAKLNSIVHPYVGQEIMTQVVSASNTDEFVFLDVPLLLESDGASRYPVEKIVVVDLPVEIAVERLENMRGMPKEDALSRVNAQIDREKRLEVADFVIDNSLGVSELEDSVDKLIKWLNSEFPGVGGSHFNR